MTRWPVNHVLLKVFVRGFYRAHSGLFVYFFVTLITYFFFINVLNQTHISREERVLYNLSLTLAFLNSPAITVGIFVAWLIYNLKSWDYITAQLRLPENQFLLYSCTSLDKFNQFTCWLAVQLAINLPTAIYGLFAVVIGIVFDYYLIPVVMTFYILFLAIIGALRYVYVINNSIDASHSQIVNRLFRNWPKPYPTLFLYHIADRLKTNYLVTKLFSLAILVSAPYFFSDVATDARLGQLMVLGVVMAHVVIIYQSHRFENYYITFSRNFPYSRSSRYVSWVICFLILVLPETIWLLVSLRSIQILPFMVFMIASMMLLRSFLYVSAMPMKRFLAGTFYFFIALFLIILSSLFWPAMLIVLLSSFIVFNRTYYKHDSILRT